MKLAYLLAPLFFATAAQAQDAPLGEQYFSQYCSTCHGVKAKGDGALTQYLSITVPDLTGLAARNDGEFPLLKVIQIIDGRSGMRTHEGPMPVYGAAFRSELQPELGISGAVEPLIRGRVLMIAEYIESLQE